MLISIFYRKFVIAYFYDNRYFLVKKVEKKLLLQHDYVNRRRAYYLQ